MAPTVTSNLHHLPFESLDPKRFEDLVRQLSYDFRVWRAIEATGRSGSDQGFDARAFEIVPDASTVSPVPESGDEEEVVFHDEQSDRLWLIQCKRERAIGPSKLLAHLNAIPPESFDDVYGMILAAACDFSKAARDTCRNWCRQRGIQEVHIWGKAEIEDQLYQPKNDNLLFAYFGISLQMRRQAQGVKLRRRMTLKRKIKRHLSEPGWPGQTILMRDPTDDRYPDTDGKTLIEGGFLWTPYYCLGVGVHGLRVLVRCLHGYVNHETGEWDFASALNRAIPNELNHLWRVADDAKGDNFALIDRWSQLPRGNQSFIRWETWLPFDEIIEIDEIGDDELEVPTVFTRFRDNKPPLLNYGVIAWETGGFGGIQWHRDRHVRLFDDQFRDADWENAWAANNGVNLSTEPYPFPSPKEANRVAAEGPVIDPDPTSR